MLTAALFVNTVMVVPAWFKHTKDTSVSKSKREKFLFSCSNDCLENRIGDKMDE